MRAITVDNHMATKQAPGFRPKKADRLDKDDGERLKRKVLAAYLLDPAWQGAPHYEHSKVVGRDGHNYVAVRDANATLIALYRVRIDGERFRRLSDQRDTDGKPMWWPTWATKEA
jgi:hypothetical protein